MFIYTGTFTPITWKRGTLKTLVERAYLICSTPSLLEKELTHIRTVFRNTNGYPNWIINQLFKQVKAKQRDPVLITQILITQTKMKPRKLVTKQ